MSFFTYRTPSILLEVLGDLVVPVIGERLGERSDIRAIGEVLEPP